MAKSQSVEYYEKLVEPIIFNETELETLKIAIKNFTEGKTSAIELKKLLLQCRGRMVEDMAELAFMIAQRSQAEIVTRQPASPTEVESQLRKEIEEKNELLETVAKRVNNLVNKLNNEEQNEDQKPNSIEEVNEEVERCLKQIGAKEWIDMCFYEDTAFFVKLYPKLEALYKERFGEREKSNSAVNDGKFIMANKMERLGFPEEVETMVIQYISIRNNFQHSMADISQSNFELARDVFVHVFVDLILTTMNSSVLLNGRELVYSELKGFFSKQFTGNSSFRKRALKRLETVLCS